VYKRQELREPLATCRHPERPCVVVSAHLGNWEVVCSAMAKLGMPNASLYSPPTNPLLDRLLLESRRALNCELLPRDNSARSLVRAMKAGRTAGMVMDRRVDDGTPVRFFGYDKPSTLIPAKLALKFGCDLVPAQVVRLGDARFRVIFHPPIRPTADGGDETALATDMIQRLHAQFESWIRQQPEDWFCSKRLWAKGTLQQLEESGGNAGVGNHGS
jgi:KDO2-lipid IV(A) lauroyltransferase